MNKTQTPTIREWSSIRDMGIQMENQCQSLLYVCGDLLSFIPGFMDCLLLTLPPNLLLLVDALWFFWEYSIHHSFEVWIKLTSLKDELIT